MKAKVLQAELFKGLSIVSRFVAPRAQLPVLSNILISAGSSGIKLSATNLEAGIVYHLGAKVEEIGEITVPARTIVELVANLPPGQILLEAEKEHLKIKTQRGNIKMNGILASEFPSIPERINKPSFSLSPQILAQIKSQVAFAATDDESRPILTGVMLSFTSHKLQAVATDGFRLSCETISLKGAGEHKLLVPARLIDELAKISAEGGEDVGVAIAEKTKQIIFSAGNMVLTGRLLEGEFPNFEKIVPKGFVFRATIDREALLSTVKAVAVIAREAGNILKLKLKDGQILLMAESQQYGTEEMGVEAKVEGGEVEIAFNYRFIQDFLGSVEGAEVSIETEGATSPAVFRDTQEAGYFHLIMPIRLQN